MQIREINNKNLWENFISAQSPQSLFQSWNWGETVKKTQDKKVRFLNRFGLFDKNDILLGIFQVVKIKARRGIFLHLRQLLLENIFRELLI